VGQNCQYAECENRNLPIPHRDCRSQEEGTGRLENPQNRLCRRWHKYSHSKCNDFVAKMPRYAIQVSDGGAIYNPQYHDLTVPCDAP
jgi:hypothetical protein